MWNDDYWDADPDWEWNSAAEDSPEELHGLWQRAVSIGGRRRRRVSGDR